MGLLHVVAGLLAAGAVESRIPVEEAGESECQDLSTCPACYNNTLPDYNSSDPSGLVVDDALYSFMESTESLFLGMVAQLFPASGASKQDPSVFAGSGGRALIYLRRYDATGDPTDLATASAYVGGAVASVKQLSKSYCGFLWGATGVYGVAAAVASRQGDASNAQGFADKITAVFEASSGPGGDAACPYDDWDSGRAGLLYASTWLDEQCGSACAPVPRHLVTAVAQAVVDRGFALSSSPAKAWLEWQSPIDGETWLGQSHGSAGVLHGLLTVPEVAVNNATARALIVGTLNHIVSCQQPSGNFPTEYYAPDEDVLVQWDHGAPGVMAALAQGALVYPEDPSAAAWVASALRAADCAWARGLLTKGLQLCHGVGGNTHMQLALGRLLAQLPPDLLQKASALNTAPAAKVDQMVDPAQYVWRALQFQQFVKATPSLHDPDVMRKPTPNPYDFYTASYESGAATWRALMANRGDPAAATMPAY